MKGLEELKKEIEIKFGRQLMTPVDFDELYLSIKKNVTAPVSVSSLKRLWGYVKYDHNPRRHLLNSLSQYLGYNDWIDFMNSDKISDTSGFLNENVIESDKLKPGVILEVGWAPNRVCELSYLGGGMYEVVKAENSKIIEGDKFICHIFALGEPMMCATLIRNGRLLAEGYVAAGRRGLNALKIKKRKEE